LLSRLSGLYAVCPSRRRLSLILAVGAGFYTARISINTDINTLISPDLDWRKRDNQFEQAFDRERLILAVVEAPTPELTSAASKALAEKLVRRHQAFRIGAAARFRRVLREERAVVPAGGGGRQGHRPVRIRRAPDRDHGRRSQIRGLTGALETGLAGVKRGQVKLDSTERPFNLIAQTVETS
jgi:hypothetical protein